jgi:hypothetical protein
VVVDMMVPGVPERQIKASQVALGPGQQMISRLLAEAAQAGWGEVQQTHRLQEETAALA